MSALFMFKIFGILLSSSLICSCALAAENKTMLGIGLGGGINSAFGYGFEFDFFPRRTFEINSGLGVDYSGIKYGIGFRVNFYEAQNYFLKSVKERAFIGVSVSRNNGAELTIKSNSDDVKYKIFPHESINGNIGYGYIFSDIISSTLRFGYMKPLNSRTPALLSGLESSSTKKDASEIPANGLEMSLGIMILL
jgi:hypothetical protein